MYIFTRCTGDGIRIGNDIWLTVVDFHPHKNQVRLGVRAPNIKPVCREEDFDLLQSLEEDENATN